MKKSTIIRSVLFFVVLINYILKVTGKEDLHITENEVINTFDTMVEVLILILSWWKNNSFTKNAQRADRYLEKLKMMKNAEDKKEV